LELVNLFLLLILLVFNITIAQTTEPVTAMELVHVNMDMNHVA